MGAECLCILARREGWDGSLDAGATDVPRIGTSVAFAVQDVSEYRLGLFDDGATSHFTKISVGKIAGTRQAVKSTYATGTNKQGARPTETNLHAIVLISADGKETEPRIERMN